MSEQGLSVNGASILIVSNVIGAGALLLPEAFHSASIIPGTIALLVMGALATLTAFYITLAAQKTRKFSYKEILVIAIGPRFAHFFEIVLFFYCYLVLVGWSKIIIDSLPPVLEQFGGVSSSSFAASKWFWLVVSGAIFWPISSFRNLANLKIFSLMAFLIMVFILIIMVTRLAQGYYTKNAEPDMSFKCATWNTSEYSTVNSTNIFGPSPQDAIVHDDLPWASFTLNFVSVLPQLSVSYSLHYNVSRIFAEVRRRSVMRMVRALIQAYSVIIAYYLSFALVGVLTFGDGITKSHGDTLTCYSDKDTAMNIGRLTIAAHFWQVFPLVSIACRRNINALLGWDEHTLEQWILVVQAGLLVVTSSLIAYVVPGINVVFTLSGAFCGLAIVFIIPSVFYLRLFAADFDLAARLREIEEQQLLEQEEQRRRREERGGGEAPVTPRENQVRDDAEPRSLLAFGVNQGSGTKTPQVFIDEDGGAVYTDRSDSPDRSAAAAAAAATAARARVRGAGGDDDGGGGSPLPPSGYGTLSDPHMSPPVVGDRAPLLRADGDGGGDGAVAVAESIPTPLDEWAEELMHRPSPVLRGLAYFTAIFGTAASIVSIVNAFRNIAEGKTG